LDQETVRWARVWIPQRNQGHQMVYLDSLDDLKADLWEVYPGHVIGWREGSIKNVSLFNHLTKICYKKGIVVC
jgi:hypothetical protein